MRKKSRLPFTIPKAAALAVVAFLFVFFAAIQCEDAEAETILEVGAGFLSWDYSGGQVIIFTERFAGKYDIGVGLVGRQECKCRDFKPELDRKTEVDTISFLYAQRVATWKRLEFGLGFGFWNKPSRISSSILMFPLSIKFRMTDHLYIGARHFSSGGSGKPNLGQDMATLSWKF